MASPSETHLWLSLHLPRLGLEICTRSLPDGAVDRPVVLVEAHRVVQSNGTARARGLEIGMSLSTAESICADLSIAWRDRERETATLERLAAWAYRFTPRVSPEPPDALLLELAGSLRLFRGLDRLQQHILEGLRDLGYSAVPGVAPTPLAARALALSGRTPDVERLAADLEFEGRGDDALRRSWCRAVARAARPALMHMPLVHLARPGAEQEKFEAMGLRTLGDVLRLPRAPLGRRFGASLLDHLDRLTGRRPDPRPVITPPEIFRSTVHFLEDLEHHSALAFPMQRLVGELEDWLRLRQMASDRLDWVLSHPRHGEQRMTVHFAAPQRERGRMLEFSRLQLEREPGLPAVASLELRVTRLSAQAAARGGRDEGLFPALGDEGGTHEDPATLVDLLHARFGPGICAAIAPADDHRPEHAWKKTSPRPPGRRERKDEARLAKTAPGPRPLWLLETPRPLAERGGTPMWHGPLELRRGPERIDTGWWERSERCLLDLRRTGSAPEGPDAARIDETVAGRDALRGTDPQRGEDALHLDADPDADPERRSDAFTGSERALAKAPAEPATLLIAPPAPRDYWIARHGDGGHYWVFQDLASGRWFLHGIFA